MATGNLEDFMNYLPFRREGVPEQPKYKNWFDLDCMPYDEGSKLPILDKKFVKWLFTQLKGLADALDHLHHLVRDEDESRSQTLKPEQTKSNQVTGYHHDIKPDNILVFFDDKSGYGTMKIGDFGSANIMETDDTLYQKSPVFTEKIRGAKTFSSPDAYCGDGRMTRKADIWTLGCVFLEVLIWCLEKRRTGVKSFATERGEESHPDPKSNIHIDDYWRWDQTVDNTGRQKPVLKTAVIIKLRDIGNECRAPHMKTFLAVHRLTTQMMWPDSAGRINSSTLTKELDYICANVESHLRQNKDFYCGTVDLSKVKNNSPYLDLPPSPSTVTPSYVRTRSRSRSPRRLDLEADPSRPLSAKDRVLQDLEQTDGQWANLVTSTTKDDVLATSEPSDILLRGRERTNYLGATDFTMRRRSPSGKRAAILRRNMSDPTTEDYHTP